MPDGIVALVGADILRAESPASNSVGQPIRWLKPTAMMRNYFSLPLLLSNGAWYGMQNRALAQSPLNQRSAELKGEGDFKE